MTLLNILQYPDPRLKKIATPINLSDNTKNQIKELIANMLETMYQAKGIGLAATQIDQHIQLITIDLSPQANEPLYLINPKIIQQQYLIKSEEGCLSFPGIYAQVERFSEITVEFLDINNSTKILTAKDLLSICIQHEIDHLNGITFFDHLSPLKRLLLEKKLNKLRKKNE